MNYSLTTQALDKAAVDCLLIAVFEGPELSEPGQMLDRISQGYLSGILDRGDLKGSACSTLLLHDVPHISARQVLLVGVGKKESYHAAQLNKALKAAYQQIMKLNCRVCIDAITGFAPVESNELSLQLTKSILAVEEARYQFNACKSIKSDAYAIESVMLALPETANSESIQSAVSQGSAIATGINLCKDLANLPGNICTPTYLAEQARGLSKKYSNIKCHVMEEKEMLKNNMGALLSVSRGSEQPAKLITLEYSGGDKNQKPIVLVGKGVTFDSGGISLKPSPAMDEMKFDMCGAASVLGTLAALGELQAPINVIGIIPTTENLPGSKATKPGDIVTSMSGQTIEILNTDAEGRLILCDAITHAKSFNPAVVIDIATLTGAIVIALGNDITGLFSNDENLATDLQKISITTADHTWRLPLWEPYQELLNSNFADMANVGNRTAGSITAAGFLSRFTTDLAWAHLDIAGVAWSSGKEKGATGRPVHLLTQYCLSKINDTAS